MWLPASWTGLPRLFFSAVCTMVMCDDICISYSVPVTWVYLDRVHSFQECNAWLCYRKVVLSILPIWIDPDWLLHWLHSAIHSLQYSAVSPASIVSTCIAQVLQGWTAAYGAYGASEYPWTANMCWLVCTQSVPSVCCMSGLNTQGQTSTQSERRCAATSQKSIPRWGISSSFLSEVCYALYLPIAVVAWPWKSAVHTYVNCQWGMQLSSTFSCWTNYLRNSIIYSFIPGW